MRNHAVVGERDELTAVASRRAALQALGDAVADNAMLECLVLDIDNFDALNAHLGSKIADQVLVEVAAVVAAALPDFTVGRLGSDQFIAFGHRETTEADRLALTVFEVVTDAGPQTVQVSVGQSSASVSGRQAEGLLRDALGALRIAKGTGKQRLVVADAELACCSSA